MSEPTKPVNPFAARLMDLVMSKKTAYTALIEAVEPLRGYIATESDCYEAAFKVVGKTRTVDQIVQAIDYQHTPALDEQVSAFKVQLQQQEEEDVSAQQRDMTSLQQQMAADNEEVVRIRAAADKQIAQLNEGVEQSKKKIATLQGVITSKQSELNVTKNNFDEAVQAVRDHLAQAKSLVLQHLKPA